MRRVIMMEADVTDGSTPLLDTFDDIAEGQSKITIAQVKVCSASQRLPAGVHCTAAASQQLPAGVHCAAVLLSGFLLVYIVLQCFSVASCWCTLYCSYHLPFSNDDQESGLCSLLGQLPHSLSSGLRVDTSGLTSCLALRIV